MEVFGLVDGQVWVGADHPVRAALGEEGVLVPTEKKHHPGTLMFHQLLSAGHAQSKLAHQFHFNIGK